MAPETKDFGQTCNRLTRKRPMPSSSTPKKSLKLDLSDVADDEDDEIKDPSYLPVLSDPDDSSSDDGLVSTLVLN